MSRHKMGIDNLVAERPIFYNTAMVQAHVSGRKSVTRRMDGLDEYNISPDNFRILHEPDSKLPNSFQSFKKRKTFGHVDYKTYWDSVFCPFGKVGDRLYVRETYRLAHYDYDAGEVRYEYAAGGELWAKVYSPEWVQRQMERLVKKGLYRYDEDFGRIIPTSGDPLPWKPSIHMPKHAARVWLEITEVRIERLNSLTEAQAIAEGVELYGNGTFYKKYGSDNDWCGTAYASFVYLWEELYGKESWKNNPWVWVISYKILSTTGRPVTADGEAVAP